MLFFSVELSVIVLISVFLFAKTAATSVGLRPERAVVN